MSLSVIIPATNIYVRLETLVRMVNEGLDQNYEIIIVLDNVPKEEERKLLNFFVGRNLVVVRGNFGSPGIARNAGIHLCSRKWVTFWDSDDFPQPHLIHRVLRDMSSQKEVDIVVGNFEFVNESGELQRKHTPNNLVTFGVNPGIWRFLFRRNFITEFRFPAQRMGEDLSYLAEILATHPRIAFVQQSIYGYVMNGGDSITSTLERKEIEQSLDEIEWNLLNLSTKNRKKTMDSKMSNLLALRVMVSRLKYSRSFGKRLTIVTSIFHPKLILKIGARVYVSVILRLFLKPRI